VETVIEIGADNTKMVVFGDGDVEPAYSLMGGTSGVLNSITLKLPDGNVMTPMSKDLIDNIPKGTVYRQIAGGGGGYGNPKNRESEKVVEDVRNELVSVEKAKEVYGLST